MCFKKKFGPKTPFLAYLARLKKSCQVPLKFVKLRFNAIRYVLVVQMRDQRAGLPATFKFQQ